MYWDIVLLSLFELSASRPYEWFRESTMVNRFAQHIQRLTIDSRIGLRHQCEAHQCAQSLLAAAFPLPAGRSSNWLDSRLWILIDLKDKPFGPLHLDCSRTSSRLPLRLTHDVGPFNRLFDTSPNRHRLCVFGWCLYNRHVALLFLLVGFV
jgi:hypothetical protein